jgi:hypothetical protein
MDEEEVLTLRDILTDFRKGAVQLDYVEAHIAVLVDQAREDGYHCSSGPSAKETMQKLGTTPNTPAR